MRLADSKRLVTASSMALPRRRRALRQQLSPSPRSLPRTRNHRSNSPCPISRSRRRKAALRQRGIFNSLPTLRPLRPRHRSSSDCRCRTLHRSSRQTVNRLRAWPRPPAQLPICSMLPDPPSRNESKPALPRWVLRQWQWAFKRHWACAETQAVSAKAARGHKITGNHSRSHLARSHPGSRRHKHRQPPTRPATPGVPAHRSRRRELRRLPKARPRAHSKIA